LIVGDTTAPIEGSAFLVQNGKIGRVGRKGEIELPAGATRVDLTGKTVMPALVSTHVHVGLLNGMSFGPENYTHENIVEHLQRYAYYGLAAVLSPGTDVGPLAFQVRKEQPSGAARLLTAGRGMAAPDGGPGIPSIANTSFPITSAEDGRLRVRELAEQGANAVKIWVDDRNGRVKKLTPEIYGPIIDEAHKHGMMAVAHVYYLKDAHQLVDAGIDGFMHLVRDEVMDDELIAKMKQHNVFTAANIGGTHRAALSEAPAESLALLAETVPPSVVEQYRASYAKSDPKAVAAMRSTYQTMEKSLARLNAAGITIALGGDTGIPGAWHGWAEQYELERMVAAGMTPAQVIVASTSVGARILKLDDLGAVATGKSADFLVLDANPLENITNTRRISAVYLKGQMLDRSGMHSRWTAGPGSAQQSASAQVPQFTVDPSWPKKFPTVKAADGNLHRWATGEIGGTCIDSHDHIFTLNRGWQNSSLGKLHMFEAMSSVPAPPVVAYDPDGSVAASWGDASVLAPNGGTKVMPESLHGCFADYENNIWIAGNADGIVQKYSHDGKLLMQIGTKGVCDGRVATAPSNPPLFFPTCVSPGLNGSKTLLNDPADIAVDPNPDPVTNERGSVYIADGYGNHRIVVFSGRGQYLRQWGSAGTGDGQFAAEGGGHPHCVTIGNDGLVYTCDRGNARVEVFDRTGTLKRIIPINPEGFSNVPLRTNDIAFSKDPGQAFFYTSDVGSGTVWILDRMKGAIVGGIGGMGQGAGSFIGVHTMAVDSKGNLYVSEGGGGRRTQKFVKQ
jgi:imidazolonepropionase-like amidohydrolase/sugar lactone lactonase YvrE